MKLNRIYILLLMLAASCAEPRREPEADVTEEAAMTVVADTFPISTVITHVECKKNPVLSYALFLPHQYKVNESLPALIFTDPHGDGSFPLNMYFELAEKYGAILIGSNDCKNGLTFNQTSPMLQALIAEAASRFTADGKEISLAGFSGGAKAAMVAASEMPDIHTLIYCSAGFKQIPNPLPPALGITGMRDMNYTEVIETDRQLIASGKPHAVLEWNGKHEWSDPKTFENAFYWIHFRAMEKKLKTVNHDMVKAFISANRNPDKSVLKEEKRLMKLINFLNGVADVTAYSNELATLRKQQSYLSAKQKEQDDFTVEMRAKENYIQCIEIKDLMWWRDEMLNFRKAGNNPMNDRIKGYISLACYSFSNNAMKKQDLKSAEKYLGVYSLVDPENPDRAFMQACLYAQRQNKTGALQSLQEAISYGLNDKSKLESEPSFAWFRNSPEFNALLLKISNP
jgi:hypothetical protein